MSEFRTAGLRRRSVLTGGISLWLIGCSQIRFPVTPAGQGELPARNIRVIQVSSENIGQLREPARSRVALAGRNPPPNSGRYTYRVGPGDTLQITFYADPAGVTAASENAPQTTAVIDETGEFFFPFVGKVQAEGRTVSQIRDALTQQLLEFFERPQVEIAVSNYNARRVTITGAVGAPGRKALTNVSVTLLDLVNEAGAAPEADLRRITIRRGSGSYLVNLRAFLDDGNSRYNPVLLPNDLVQVPLAEDNKVFTFGEINVGEIPLTGARKTLLEVLAESGGIDRVRADARGIFVFRRDDPGRIGFDVYQFDLRDAAALVLAAEFGVAPLDIVFVTNDPVTRWSDTIGKIVAPFDSLVRARSTAQSLDGTTN